jgi:PTH1 family peptidyl-tRNA hydrolase
MISLIVFLGNPGAEYAANRHNAARQFAETLPFAGLLEWKRKFRGQCAALERAALPAPVPASGKSPENAGGRLWFLKPETYMNLSGESAGAFMRFYRIPPAETLVVQDELELPLGTVSLKFSGGLGGHNGLRSVAAVCGTRDFWRLRFGIGRPEGADVLRHVLSDFLPAERETLRAVFAETAALISALFSAEPETLLAPWGKKKLIDST